MTLAWGAKVRGRWRQPGPMFFQAAEGPGAFLCPDRESGVVVSWECGTYVWQTDRERARTMIRSPEVRDHGAHRVAYVL